MPTISLLSRRLPVEPKKAASPKAKIPPSDATSQEPVPGMASAVLVNRAATCWAVIPGFTAHTRAAEADTIGVANEVPSGVTQQFPSPHGVARVRTPTPGAAMSTHGP